MKKNYFPYAIAIILSLMTRSAFCMEDAPTEGSDRHALTTQLKKLQEQKKEEVAYNAKLFVQHYDTLTSEFPNDGILKLPPRAGIHDDYIESENRLFKITQHIKDIEKKLNVPE
ncbi:MAG: hypothetical protein K0M45_12130 [Candidatus Paracaedibacteraceae bacterium]|nr:hypothetical protein [Candidatus Paracaedibacteraceae bacterium]